MIDRDTFKDEYRRCLDRLDLGKLDAVYAGADAAHAEGDDSLDEAMDEARREFAADSPDKLTDEERAGIAASLRALIQQYSNDAGSAT